MKRSTASRMSHKCFVLWAKGLSFTDLLSLFDQAEAEYIFGE
jgi:hypothetical protein